MPRWWNVGETQAIELIPNYWGQLYPITYYYIGTYLKRYPQFVERIKAHCKWIIIAVIVFTGINFSKNFGNEFIATMETSYRGYQCLVVSILLFCMLLNTTVKYPFQNAIGFISKYSFGAYMISSAADMVVNRLLNLAIGNNTIIKILLFPCSIGTVLLLSLLGSFVITNIVTWTEKKITTMSV